MIVNHPFVKKILALIHPYYLFKYKTNIVLSRIRYSGAFPMRLEDSWVVKTSISFFGNNHEIIGNNCHLHNSEILLQGEGHRLIIEKNVQLFNVRIIIKGKNNTVFIGKGTTFGGGDIIHGGENLSIHFGENCLIANGVGFWSTDTHSIMIKGGGPEPLNKPSSIFIGNHVWIGKDATVLKGVRIGDDAVIGMKALVTKDIAPETINVGIPTHPVRKGVTWSRVEP